ncbi:putative pentatricopeptide repeat-containing protein At3g28640 [Papaver somniferum]|uniref:putative pentatricopeptide repeat-containing protein At3g28640 n=1 Tax=Papaver somniferum TaxID=3469 RepID=UPI000E6FA106|nr:putative pentatricopeptide repeat-containing protein At3g28640 [Papaver somniferum]
MGSVGAWKWCMSLISSCKNYKQFKSIHAIFITNGFHQNTYAISKLISFLSLYSHGNLSYASLLFQQTHAPNAFIYNTLIRAYSSSSQPHLSIHYFHLMLNDSKNDKSNNNNLVVPDYHTFPFILIACAKLNLLSDGKKIHAWILKNGLASSDRHLQTALLRFYLECSGLIQAQMVFDEIPLRDVIQWNVLINGYLRLGNDSKALTLFREMFISGVEPDEFCVATSLTACAHLGALQQGIWIHEYIHRKEEFIEDVFVGTALVDMYAKCGCIDKAVEVFEKIQNRNVFSWAAMIGGFAVHGFAEVAIHCLERMVNEDGIKPDGVVLLGILTACTHAGLEKQGWFLLENMEAKYKIVPKHERYSCMVDLLCRSGHLDEAVKLIRKMPMKPLASVWGALLSACRGHGNVELAELAVEELVKLENENGVKEDGTYVQLSNIYLGARRSDDAHRIRKMISDKGIKRTPGCSVVEVDGVVNEFVAGDVTHPSQLEIHSTLGLLSIHISEDSLTWLLGKESRIAPFDIFQFMNLVYP